MSPAVAGARILVTGGAGFVGSNLIDVLLREGAGAIEIVDNLLSSERDSVPEDDRVTFVEGSVSDDGVLARLSPDVDIVFHLATYHGNQSSIADPLADHQNNTLTTLKLYEWIKRLDRAPRVVYSSAGCTVAEKTFDEAAATTEDSPVSLWHDSPYQISKIVGEFYANYYSLRHGVETVKARFQNVYGPGEVLGAGQWRGTPNTVWRNVVPTFIWKALNAEPLLVENEGVATRDFIYVADIVAGLVACSERGEPGGVYNLGSGRETSIRALADLVNELTGNLTPITLTPARDWDRSGKRHADVSRAQGELGFKVSVELRDGLEQTISWTRGNEDRIARCVSRHSERLAGVAEYA